MAKRQTIQPASIAGGRFNFRSLLESATGKDFSNISAEDVGKWAEGQGWRKRDINRIKKGFTKFSKRGGDFVLGNEGEFNVAGAGKISTRGTGNVAGFDLGDFVGAGRDVSLLAGALETIAPDKIEVPEELTAIQPTFNFKGSSGQGGQQIAAQRVQQNQKDASPKQTKVPEGPADPATSPNEVLDLSELGFEPPKIDTLGEELNIPVQQEEAPEEAVQAVDARVQELLNLYQNSSGRGTSKRAIAKQLQKYGINPRTFGKPQKEVVEEAPRTMPTSQQRIILRRYNNLRQNAFFGDKSGAEEMNQIRQQYFDQYGIKLP